jgi:hypothetical protein
MNEVPKAMTAKFFRIHIEDIAYYTKRPKGLFAAVGNLVDQKVMNDAEIEAYWRQRRWFEANLPMPPFYGNPMPTPPVTKPILPITWYKKNALGTEMLPRMGFYVEMALKYGRALFITSTDIMPGEIVYEDDFQIGVANSRHSGPGFNTVPYRSAIP